MTKPNTQKQEDNQEHSEDHGDAKSREKLNCHSIFFPGTFCSQAQLSKYTQGIVASTTGEFISCQGRNHLPPLKVLINPFVGTEAQDIDTNPFEKKGSYFNPLTLLSVSLSKAIVWYHGIRIHNSKDPTVKNNGSLKYYGINIAEINFGQEKDIASHWEKYKLWKEANPECEDAIFGGDSKGAATTFNAIAKFKYREAKLVILEGCFYSIEDVLAEGLFSFCSSIASRSLSFFTKYRSNGPSPAKSVDEFPENIPVVFITSKIDKIVPCRSTEKLAKALANKGKNDVYLLKLARSSHPNYMFDDKEDRDRYESLIHAIYRRYGFPYEIDLAEKGEPLLDECILNKAQKTNSKHVYHSAP